MKTALKRLLLFTIILLSASTAKAADIYLAQSAAGSGLGTSCADARTVSGTTWAAGNTYHLCGTLTAAFAPNASGTIGAHIVIRFEPGSKISMGAIPSSGAINLSGRQYIDVDGANVGIIESLTNGTATGRVDSHGVDMTGSNLTVHGLTFQNLYKYVCCGGDNGGIGVYANGNGITNLRIYDNIFTAMFAGVEMQLGSGTGSIEIDHNTLPNQDVAWGFAPVQGYSNSATNGLKIHDNDITPGSGATPGSGNSWCTGPSDLNHLDPIHTWSQGSGGGIINELIYNNYVHGSFCVVGGTANSTAAIFWEAHVDGGSAPNTPYVFNNFVRMQGGHPGDGGMFKQQGTGGLQYNNTTDCTGADNGGIGTEQSSGAATYTGNIIAHCPNRGFYNSGATITGTANDFFSNGTNDLAGLTSTITTNPLFDANFVPQAGSPAIAAAPNLTSLGVAEMLNSKPLLVGAGHVGEVGVPRPLSGNWTMGAYEPSSSPSPIVSLSPTSLTFTTRAVGTTSPALTSTLTNTGGATLTISSITVTGTNSGDFGHSNNCGSSVGISASCTISVTFSPTATGTRSASISIAGNASGSLPVTGPATQAGNTAPVINGGSSTAQLTPGTQGIVYSGYSFTVSGGTPPYNWTANPTFPGLPLGAATGAIAGTPTASGNFISTVTVTDSSSPVQSASITANLNVAAAPPPPTTYKWTLTPTTLSFTSAGTNPAAKTLTIDDNSPSSQTFTVVLDQPWLSYTVTKTGSATPAPSTQAILSVAPKVAGLSAGTYTGHIVLMPKSASGLPNTSVIVTLTVTGAPPPPQSLTQACSWQPGATVALAVWRCDYTFQNVPVGQTTKSVGTTGTLSSTVNGVHP